jgi:hypothetical protein
MAGNKPEHGCRSGSPWLGDPMSPTKDELKRLLFGAVRSYMKEDPRIGGKRAREWAVSTRIAVHLARTKIALDAENSDLNILVDAEYSQQGLAGDPKINHLLKTKKRGMRPDIIMHRRGATIAKFNWIACEVKLHSSRTQPVPNSLDILKLRSLKHQFRYRLAIWLSLPRIDGDAVYYTEVKKHGAGTLQRMPLK